MNTTENKKHIEIAPTIGISIILVLLAIAGLFFYKGLMSQESFTAETLIDVQAVREHKQAQESDPITIEEELAQIEKQLEEVTVDVSGDDLFGLEQLDAELIDFSDLDEIFDFEL